MRNPAVFLETAGLSALPTPTGLFLPSQQPLSESPKLPALRADVSAKVRTRHLGFLLPRRFVDASSISLVPPQAAVLVHSAASPLSTEPVALVFGRIFVPHVGATCGFETSGGYALGCAVKAAQTADTGATAREGLAVTAASPSRAVHTSFPCPPAGQEKRASGHPRKSQPPEMPALLRLLRLALRRPSNRP